MTRVHFVGDGERDRATLPGLVRGILAEKAGPEVHLQPSFDRWAHLHRPGLDKKLRFAVLQTRDRQAEALVAAVDRDRAPTRERLRALRDARTEIRKKDLMPVALGEAVPHGEAWVLGDPEAVRKALGLGAGAPPSRASRDRTAQGSHPCARRRPASPAPPSALRSAT